jgi:hypothetical protein
MVMNHKAILDAESRRLYENRNFVLHLLDDRHFDALNQTPVYRDEHGELHEKEPAPVLALNGYCLDALDESPAGAMQSAEKNLRYWRTFGYQLYTVRGLTLADLMNRAALAEQLIAEILAERREEDQKASS